MPIDAGFFVGLLGFSSALICLVHLGRARLTLVPIYAVAGVFVLLLWHIRELGWWVDWDGLQIDAALVGLLPPLLAGMILVYAMDGIRAARAYLLILVTTSAIGWGFVAARRARRARADSLCLRVVDPIESRRADRFRHRRAHGRACLRSIAPPGAARSDARGRIRGARRLSHPRLDHRVRRASRLGQYPRANARVCAVWLISRAAAVGLGSVCSSHARADAAAPLDRGLQFLAEH